MKQKYIRCNEAKIHKNKYDAIKQKYTKNKCNEAVLWPQPAHASLVKMVLNIQNMCASKCV